MSAEARPSGASLGVLLLLLIAKIAAEGEEVSMLWNFTTEGLAITTPLVLGDRVFVCAVAHYSPYDNSNGGIFAINASTGASIWTTSFLSQCNGPVVGNSAFVLVGTEASYSSVSVLTALHPQTGSLLWQINGSYSNFHAPALSADGSSVYLGLSQMSFSAYDTSTGRLRWLHYSDGPCNFPSPISRDGSLVYFTTNSDVLRALDTATGKEVWSSSFSNIGDTTCVAAVLGDDGDVYLSSISAVFRFDWKTGKQQWNASSALGGQPNAPNVVKGVAYTTDSYGNLMAIATSSGELLWLKQSNETSCYEFLPSQGGVIAAGVMVASCDEKLIAYDLSVKSDNMKIAWQFDVNGYVYAPSMFDSSTGRLYQGTQGGSVIVLQL